MQTYVKARALVRNPHFAEQRQKALSGLASAAIDAPLAALIAGFAKLPYCFTLQCCWGHFVHEAQTETRSVAPLPARQDDLPVTYRIAYIALCVENSEQGQALLEDMSQLPAIDPAYIQYGCAQWFWSVERQVNTYVAQVEPERFKTEDQCVVGYQEALHIQQVRGEFFAALGRILEGRL